MKLESAKADAYAAIGRLGPRAADKALPRMLEDIHQPPSAFPTFTTPSIEAAINTLPLLGPKGMAALIDLHDDTPVIGDKNLRRCLVRNYSQLGGVGEFFRDPAGVPRRPTLLPPLMALADEDRDITIPTLAWWHAWPELRTLATHTNAAVRKDVACFPNAFALRFGGYDQKDMRAAAVMTDALAKLLSDPDAGVRECAAKYVELLEKYRRAR